MLEFHGQLLIFSMGMIGAFIWLMLSYRIIPNFRMETQMLGHYGSIIAWCLLGGLLAWLLEMTSSYGLHPTMLCGIFAGFGWSGLFTGIAGTIIHRRDRRETNGLIRDLGE